jgi:CO dehydrogenase/acetyl-CoA synthase beta subunit
MVTQAQKPIEIDLEGIELDEIKLFVQEGARGNPEMVASCQACRFPCASCGCFASP